MTAWWVHAAALWLWHIPRFFQATLDNDWIHSAQHVSFLGSALLFWWSLFYAHGKVRYGASVLYLFTTAVHTSILGALLTFASTVWYPDYAATTPAWGLTPLEDQQVGGLIMWIPAGLVYRDRRTGALRRMAARERPRRERTILRTERANMRLSLLLLALMLAACSLRPNAVPDSRRIVSSRRARPLSSWLRQLPYHSGHCRRSRQGWSKPRRYRGPQLRRGPTSQPALKPGALDSTSAFGSSRQPDAGVGRH